ncbi:putative lipid II flippase FtsW [Collinsella aerofaciens]|uniref:putative lipid II flippase FtsW n=1 Tax=Collinsella aerofaciens TaxID=74426 RepID=UPI00359CB85A
MRRPDSDRASSQRSTPRSGRGGQTLGERYIAGVPARIMRPRLIFMACLFTLVCFGLLMVYSASSVEALHENGSATYFLFRQLGFTIVGMAALEFIARLAPDSCFKESTLKVALFVMIGLLLLVFFVGSGSRGATRWLNIAGVQFQPSEFLKPFAIAYSAIMLDRFYSPGGNINEFAVKMLGCLGPSLLLIFIQPDLGTVLIILLAIACMALFAGMDARLIIVLAVAVALVMVIALIAEPYRRVRFEVTWNPWADEYGDGYQATLAIMAFASGGLFGRGIGDSTMKYSYLPEAHNDYILAIIGEEVGFVGTVLFFLVFAMLIYSAFRIAEQATDRRGALMASGSAVILAVQFLINALGILNVFPMTGKPLPFISYGGSSIIVSLMLAGLILRVSHESARRDEYDHRRESFAVMDESTAGVPHVRGDRPSRNGFTVFDGSASEPAARPRPRTAPQGRPQRPNPRSSGGGYNRIDLNSDPSARLRTDDQGPRVRRDYHDR